MVSPLFEQAAFRVRNDDGSETTATWRESENVNWETPPGYNMRVRFAINQTAATADATLDRTFRLRYSKNGGAYVNIGSTSATTEAIRAALSSNFSDAAPTTDQISGTGTFVAGQMDESGATGTITFPALTLSHTEIEFSFQLYAPQVAVGDTITLRVYSGTSTELTTYTQVPSITVGHRLLGVSGLTFGAVGALDVSSGGTVVSLAGSSALTLGNAGALNVIKPLASTSSLSLAASGTLNVITGGVVELSGSSSLTFTAVNIDYDYLLEVGAGAYAAKNPSGAVVSSSTSLKTVIDAVKGVGVRLRFAAGVFDFGTEWATYNTLSGMRFYGAGIDQTFIQNDTNVASDSEPFSFTRCDDVVISGFTVSAGGSARTSSDAIDNDDGNNWRIEYVKVVASRARGIVFDGKDPGASSDFGIIRHCEVTGTQGSTAGDGIEMLGAQNNVIEDCYVHNVPCNGIQLVKGSTASGKKSNGNTVRRCTIDQAGRDGINILSSDDNLVIDCVITNSADVSSSRDGIRVETADGVAADRNVFTTNVCTDNQTPKTQRYGINIAPASAALATDSELRYNTLTGNLTAPYNDGGVSTLILDGIVNLAGVGVVNLSGVGALSVSKRLSGVGAISLSALGALTILPVGELKGVSSLQFTALGTLAIAKRLAGTVGLTFYAGGALESVLEVVPDPVEMLTCQQEALLMLLPAPPVDLAPSGTIYTTTPMLTWGAVSGAVGYTLYLQDMTSGVISTLDLGDVLSYTPGAALITTRIYNWKVRGYMSSGIVGIWSAVTSFTVQASVILSKPSLSSPANGGVVATLTPTVSWNSVPGATGYGVQVDDTSDFLSPIRDVSVGSLSYLVTPSLKNSETYYWRARAQSAAGNSEWSSSRTMIIAAVPPTPAPQTPSDASTVTTTTPTLTWIGSEIALAYDLQISRNIDFTDLVEHPEGILPAQYTTFPLAEGLYYWRVRAQGAFGLAYSYSSYYTFTVNV